MELESLFCHRDGRSFPLDQFLHDSDGNLIIPEIHPVGVPHYRTGRLVEETDGPPVPYKIADLDLLQAAHSLPSADFDDLIRDAQSWDDLIQRARNKVQRS